MITPEDDIFPKDMAKTMQVLDKFIEMCKQGYPIMNSVSQLQRIKQYYAGTIADNIISCEAIGHHLRILPDGQLNLCPWTKSVGNLNKRSLAQIWKSPAVFERFKEMRKCEKIFCRVMRGGHKETVCDKKNKIAQIYF